MDRRAAFSFLFLAALTYRQDIAPILNTRCVECHSWGNSLNLSRFPFVSKMTEDQGAIVAMILGKSGGANPSMPPGNRPKLTAQQVSTIEQWRDEGLEP